VQSVPVGWALMRDQVQADMNTRGVGGSLVGNAGDVSLPRFFGGMGWAIVVRVIVAAAVCVGVVGCSGSGSAEIRMTPLSVSDIDPPTTDVTSFSASECYWWLDGVGDVNIAIRCTKQNLLLGKFGKQSLIISFALDEPPAGSGRNYKVRSRESRTVLGSPLMTQRFASYAGIVSTLVDDAETIHGSFRMLTKLRDDPGLLSFLPPSQGSVLVFGTYKAVRDADRGLAIRRESETYGWGRSVKTKKKQSPMPKTP